MNSILTKCVEELKTPTPRIDYVLGMLETLIDMQTPVVNSYYPPVANVTNAKDTQTIRADEEESDYAKVYAGGPVGQLST